MADLNDEISFRAFCSKHGPYNRRMPRARRYLLPSTGGQLTRAALKKRSFEVQIEAMRHWFDENFDPPHELPYNSSEGGTQWMWGGPYHAVSQLRSQFGDDLGPGVIQQLASRLNEVSTEWSGKPDDFGLYASDYLSDLIANGTAPFMTLLGSLGDIEDAAHARLPDLQKDVLYKLLFANVIAAFETFLGDLFMKTLSRTDEYLEKFVKKTGHFQNTQIRLSDIFDRFKRIDAEVRTFVLKHNWHGMDESAVMYKRAFNVKILSIPDTIKNGISQRHDIVHRNGKTREGVMGAWKAADILALKDAVLAFAGELNDRISKLSTIAPEAPEEAIQF